MALGIFESLNRRIFSPEWVSSSRQFSPGEIESKIGRLPPEVAQLKGFDFIVVTKSALSVFMKISHKAKGAQDTPTRIVVVENLNPEGTISRGTARELSRIQENNKCLIFQTTIDPEGKKTSDFIKSHPANWTVCSLVSQFKGDKLEGRHPVYSLLQVSPKAQIDIRNSVRKREKFIPANISVAANLGPGPSENRTATEISEVCITYPMTPPVISSPNPVLEASYADRTQSLPPVLHDLHARLPK